MSLVGTRPPTVDEWDKLTSLYKEVDYAGPHIEDKEIESKYKKCYYLDFPI